MLPVGKPGAAVGVGGVFWPLGSEFPAARQVRLVSGLAEITFASGAKLVLSAPVQFAIVSGTKAELQVGKLTARVPHRVAGFTIGTPAGNVVDLGTEFGVEVTPDRKLDVQVFVGQVKVAAPTDAAGGATAAARTKEVRVTAGRTLHLAPGKPAEFVASKENRFHRDLELNSDSRDRESTDYLDFVRKLKPVIWYRMEGDSPIGRCTTKCAMRRTRSCIGTGREIRSSRGGSARGCGCGDILGDYALAARYPQAAHGAFTVSAWACADSESEISTIVCNWGDTNGVGQFWIGRHGKQLDGLITRRDGHFVSVYQPWPKAVIFPLHEWQHVALVTDGAKVRLYQQGREILALDHDGLQYPVRLHALGIGVRPNDAGDSASKVSPALWSGRLDEIAIFDKALTAEEIRKLAAAPPR